MPDENAEQSFNRAKEILQEAILRDYPNPERRGCPGSEALKGLASHDLPQSSNPAWDHVTHCSPCYGEFLAFRELKKKASNRARVQRRFALATAAALILASGVWIFLHRSPKVNGGQDAQKQAPQILARATKRPAYLDFESVRTNRGAVDTPDHPRQYALPLEDLDLKIRLPIGSEDGAYQLEILPEPGQPPVASGKGTATLEDHSVFLRTQINLHGLKTGKYYIAFRRLNEEWTVLPLNLK
jgi:hypothetical protein